MVSHEPSDMIPLYDGMIISFINYEIRINLEKKDTDQVAKEDAIIKEANATIGKAANASFSQTTKVVTSANLEEETKHEEVHQKYAINNST
jgi:hypothetical protein